MKASSTLDARWTCYERGRSYSQRSHCWSRVYFVELTKSPFRESRNTQCLLHLPRKSRCSDT